MSGCDMSEETMWTIEMFHSDVKALVKAIKALIALKEGDTAKAKEFAEEAERILEKFEKRLFSMPDSMPEDYEEGYEG